MESIHEVQGIRLKDDLAWMESMSGPRWEGLIREEQQRWTEVARGSRHHQSQIKKASAVSNQNRFMSGPVEIAHIGVMSYKWNWKGSATKYDAADLCTVGHTVFVSYEDSDGAENYAIAALQRGISQPLWKYTNMSPFVGVIGGRCYSIECKNKLLYYKCVSWNTITGEDYRTEYEEKDPRYNLELIRGSSGAGEAGEGGGVLFLRRQSGPKQDVIQISSDVRLLEPICLESSRFILGSRAGEYLHWSAKRQWTLKGLSGKFPDFTVNTPELLDTERGLLVTHWEGKRTLWSIGKSPHIIWTGVGNILIDPWQGPWIRITQPGVPVAWITIHRPSVPHPVALQHFARSKDGTHIPFYTVGSVKPKGLLICAYSAYGIATNFSTARWRPLLAEGWAIVFGIYRGGGDHTPEWEDDGRLTGRINTLEDAEAVVRLARRIYDMPASSTVIYGRSAGGLWVGGLCSRYPGGDLFGGAYMEVPYLDVLRTTTNLNLPLTLLETDEFGLPAMRISDLAGILQWSPMETLPASGTPGIFQIVRTGLNDSEVFAYESAKWVVRCRNTNAERIFLAIEGGQGHFVNGDKGLEQQAEDLSVILRLAKNRIH